MQGDLDIALRGGHGEFPRIVIAPGTPIEATEKTNEAFYLSQKFGALSISVSLKDSNVFLCFSNWILNCSFMSIH